MSGVPVAFVGTGPQVALAEQLVEQGLQQWLQLQGLELGLRKNV